MESPVKEQRVIVRFKDAENLDQFQVVGDFFMDACEVLEFNVIMRPAVVNYVDQKDSKKSGLSAVIIFAESSMVLHTWPELNYATLDAFSCKEFDVRKLSEVIEQYFMPMELDIESVG